MWRDSEFKKQENKNCSMECIESHELIKPYQNLYFEPNNLVIDFLISLYKKNSIIIL